MGVTSALAEKGPGMSYELAIEASGLAKSYRDGRGLAGVGLRGPEGRGVALGGAAGGGARGERAGQVLPRRAGAGRRRSAGPGGQRVRAAWPERGWPARYGIVTLLCSARHAGCLASPELCAARSGWWPIWRRAPVPFAGAAYVTCGGDAPRGGHASAGRMRKASKRLVSGVIARKCRWSRVRISLVS